MKICYVYIFPILQEKRDFATLVPIRSAKILREDAEIFVLYSGYINREELLQYRIKPYEYGKGIMRLPLLRHFSLAYKVYKMGKQNQIDVFMNVWAHYLLLSVIIGAKLAGRKVIARVAGIPIESSFNNLPVYKRVKKRIGLLLEKLSLRLSDHVHTISNALKTTFIARGIESSKITVISQGVDISKFKPLSLHKGNESKKVLFVGRLVKNKGLQHAIRAFAVVRSQLPNVEFAIAGEGRELDKLSDLCRKLDLKEKVKFIGYVNHDSLPALYNASDLLTIPSKKEGLSNVVLEAQACGLPVLGTDVGEFSVQLKNGRGKVVLFGDYKGMAKKMIEVLSADNARAKMGKRARLYIEEEHSFEAVRRKYKSLFLNVIGNPKKQ